MIEVLIATLVMGLFLGGVYGLFFGGQRVAGRAAWSQSTVTELRTAGELITRAITATSYPATVLSSAIFDAGGTNTTPETNSSVYYVHLPQGTGHKTAIQVIAAGGTIMELCSAEVEEYGRPGRITWTVLRLEVSSDNPEQGSLILEERTANYTTAAPEYATGLILTSADCTEIRTRTILNNLESLDISATPGHTPHQITITLTTGYPRDRRLTRSATHGAIPNTGVRIP